MVYTEFVRAGVGCKSLMHSRAWHLYRSRQSQLGPAKRFSVNIAGDGRLVWSTPQPSASTAQQFDAVVVGGGSGGISFAREAARLGANVALVDFVEPSTHGSKWGIGGTCVNVGCIPKKLMHYGLQAPDGAAVEWSSLVANVQNYIRSMNFGYRVALREEGITVFNGRARLTAPNQVACRRPIPLTTPSTEPTEDILNADHVVLAMGGRPRYPDIPGTHLAITSDDVFSLKQAPGRTLVVGGGYVALECAGLLHGLGYPTTVAVRDIPLRHFDRDMAGRVVGYMEAHGVNMKYGARPVELQRGGPDKPIRVRMQLADGTESEEEYDTVLMATGRRPCTAGVGLSEVGVSLDASGKVVGGAGGSSHQVSSAEQSSVESVYAVGDILSGIPELTPVAIEAGKRLAKRLYGGPSGQGSTMDYRTIATTVFTPKEYACVGLTEEEAVVEYGEEGVEVYHLQYATLEEAGSHRTTAEGDAEGPTSYSKVICVPAEDEKVVGLHVLGPHAGEVVQGFAVAMRLGLRYQDLVDTVGIHPTHAEELVGLDRTKRSGEPFEKSAC